MIDAKTGQVIETYNSVREAAQSTKIIPSNISMVCTGQRKTAGGYKWQYINNEAIHRNKKTKAVYMISASSKKILKKFASVREASKETGIYEGSIRKVCMGNRRSAHGYIWRYEGEENEIYKGNTNQLDFNF